MSQTPDDHAAAIWHEAMVRLQGAGLAPRDVGVLRLATLVGLLDATALIAVKYDHVKDAVEGHLRDDVATALSEVLDRDVRLAVSVDPDAVAAVQEPAQAPPASPARASTTGSSTAVDEPVENSREVPAQPAAQSAPAPVEGTGAPASQGVERDYSALNHKYTFDTFVLGSSNRFAHAAATAVAEAPARAYNPLFIYGGSGLGKTHLLHAIGHYARTLDSSVRVKYVNSEEFTNQFINAVSAGQANAFQRQYRDVDVLLIDDIQFLQGKEQTMEEFFHTFNTLHNSEKQIVITSDQPPKKLSGFAERMRSRFEWGLLTDVQPPDLETRIAILRRKAAADKLDIPDDVLHLIASKISSNIRELEGALTRVTAFASLSGSPLDEYLARTVLKDVMPGGDSGQITPGTILEETAAYFTISVEEIQGASRSRNLTRARQIAMYLCRELTDLSLPKIGKEFGGRDHTTVMHAERKIKQLLSEDRRVYDEVSELTSIIRKKVARGR
ncbi:chromosomal replication initiator protein DnaA [Kytococcus schroeteri]|uniref:Chromosomal replication initiator protein DnaA n=3 Tax=Kytococcus TaxID=57499 RepID=A0A2I1PCU2_9MICO|nr:chromosomal replication initiator protein DnaA [Kytococcus schroeteri]